MTKGLKKNSALNNLIIFLLAAILWAFSFYRVYSGNEIFNIEWLIWSFTINSQVAQYAIVLTGFSIYFLTAISINYVNIKLQIIEESFQVPALFYLILSGLYLGIQNLSPVLFANIFLLLSIYRILPVYKKQNAFSNIFDSGFLLAIACFFEHNLFLFIPCILISMLILRLFDGREISSFFVGFITPIFLFGTILYISNDLDNVLLNIEYKLIRASYLKYNSMNFIISIPLLTISIIGVFSRYVTGKFNKILSRKYINLITFFCVFFLFYFVSPFSEMSSMIFIFAPLSLLAANIFINSGNVISSVLLFVLLALVIIIQIFQILYVIQLV